MVNGGQSNFIFPPSVKERDACLRLGAHQPGRSRLLGTDDRIKKLEDELLLLAWQQLHLRHASLQLRNGPGVARKVCGWLPRSSATETSSAAAARSMKSSAGLGAPDKYKNCWAIAGFFQQKSTTCGTHWWEIQRQWISDHQLCLSLLRQAATDDGKDLPPLVDLRRG